MVTAHGKTKAYLDRFKVIQSPECVCDNDDERVDHIILDCAKLDKERENLIAHIRKKKTGQCGNVT
jgi:hypothetical protein